MPPAPVRKTVQVRLAPADAFDLFTRQMSRWWPLARYSCGGADAERVEFDLRAGGQVVEHTKSGQRHVWGTVSAWEPPQRFAMTWHPAHAPEEATHLLVEFAALAGGGTEVRLTHDGWETRGQQARDSYDGGWNAVLALYAVLAEKTT